MQMSRSMTMHIFLCLSLGSFPSVSLFSPVQLACLLSNEEQEWRRSGWKEKCEGNRRRKKRRNCNQDKLWGKSYFNKSK